MLLGQVIARVELEDEHMVHAGSPPAVRVHGHQKEEENDQERCSVQPVGGREETV